MQSNTSLNNQIITPHSNLTKWERTGLFLLLSLLVVFGFIVEFRSAFLKRHMTDLGVYLRVAWAVRAGEDIYAVTDDNGWHYQYPPLFGILMGPLADPPPGVDRSWTLPFGVSVAIWYAFSVFCLIFAVHRLARALEETSTIASIRQIQPGCRRWWAIRTIPVLACLPPVGHTLMRGQVNLLLLALLCGMTAAMTRRQSWRSGTWLAGAICLKVIPAFLLLMPLWRRDYRCLAGCICGCFVGFIVVPAAVFGLPRTFAYYREYEHELIAPGLGKGESASRAKELIEMTANDSQSIMSAIHNAIYLDRETRPPQPAAWVRLAQWVIGGLFTVLSLLAVGKRRFLEGTSMVVLAGMLIINMLMLSPVSHLHYYCLAIPLVMGLLAASWDHAGEPKLTAGLYLLLGANLIANTLPNLPKFEAMRDIALAMYGGILLWFAGCLVLRKHAQGSSNLQGEPVEPMDTSEMAA